MIISQNSNDVYYAYTRGRFWRWDESARVWKESHLLTQKFGKAKAAEKHLTPEAFLTSDEFIPMDDYELPEQMLTALREAKPCKNAPIEPVEEHPTPSAQCSDAATAAENQTAASPAAPEGSSPTTELATAADAPGVPVSADENAPVPSSTAPTFDFGADDQTNALLLQDAQTFITGNMARIMAAKHAHDLTANHYQGSWGKWCAAVGISRDTGDRMVSVAAQCGNIQLEGKSILDVQPLKLLYAAAKPSTPEVVKQAVFTGDITTYKEYQELMAQLKAEKDRADAAEAHLEAANADINGLAERAQKAETERDKARADQLSTAKDCNRLGLKASQEKDRADKAEARAKDAENQLSGSRQVAEAAKLRADKLQEENAALKKQPIAAVVDEEEVDRRAKALAHQWDEEELDRLAAEKACGLADARNSELAKDNTALRKQLATLQARANDNTQADFETANYCASLFRSAWDTCKGSYSRLTGEDLESTFQTLCGALNSIMEEASLLCRQPADYDGGAADEPDV
jgi:hypothetical protein